MPPRNLHQFSNSQSVARHSYLAFHIMCYSLRMYCNSGPRAAELRMTISYYVHEMEWLKYTTYSNY